VRSNAAFQLHISEKHQAARDVNCRARSNETSMTFLNLHEVQQLMLRAYVRNVMFFATLPYYVAQEMRALPERSRRAGQTSSAP
jgi:hypothetical protein